MRTGNPQEGPHAYSSTKKEIPQAERRDEVPEYLETVHGLRFAAGSLAKFACLGTGPEICFVNQIPFYPTTGLDAWAKASISKPTPRAKKYAPPRNPAGRRQGNPSPTAPSDAREES